MDPGDIIPMLPSLLSTAMRVVTAAQPEWKKEEKALRRRFESAVEEAIGEHHRYVSAWSVEHHPPFLGDFQSETIGLNLTTTLRQHGESLNNEVLEELDVLVTGNSYAILGDPGAGKTTTLRRIADVVVHHPEVATGDDFANVVLIEARNEKWGEQGFSKVLGRLVGVDGKLYSDLDNPDNRIRAVVSNRTLILIDGIDEVPNTDRQELLVAIGQLNRTLGSSKIVFTCRSADYTVPLAGFRAVEILPLSEQQQRDLVTELLGAGESAGFFDNLGADHPASDLANRPLFLISMVALYKRKGTIPERPSQLYQSIIRLVISDWDEKRNVKRLSAYGGFDQDEKQRFLADLACILVQRGQVRFAEQELAAAYTSLAERYELPKSEARKVAREIESHTGLIVAVGDDAYEFTHLSLQEFLAAESLSRGSAESRSTWASAPAVAAVAVALSSDANSAFADFAVNRFVIGEAGSFLHRLGQERPRFDQDVRLGNLLLGLLAKSGVANGAAVAGLKANNNFRRSVLDALRTRSAIHIRTNSTRILVHKSDGAMPQSGMAVSTAVLEAIVGGDALTQIARELGKTLGEGS